MGRHTRAYPPSLSSSGLLCTFSLLDLFLDLCESSYRDIPLILAFFLLGIPLSLGFPCLMLISWLSDSFVDLYELSPRASLFFHLVQDIPSPLVCLRHPSSFGFTTIDFHLWAFQIHHHRSDIQGHFRFTTIDRTSRGISDSPPQIRHLWAFQIHHHRFSSIGISDSPPQIFIYGPLRVSPPQIGIYGHFYCITTISLHLWAFQFSVQSQLFGLASKAIIFLSLAFKVSLVIQSHSSWHSYSLALHILPSWFCICPQFSSLHYLALVVYSSRSPHRAVSFGRILFNTPRIGNLHVPFLIFKYF